MKLLHNEDLQNQNIKIRKVPQGDDNDILKCSVCGKHYLHRHMWIGLDNRCIICFQRYQGYQRNKLNIKKTYNFIKRYLIKHYYIKDSNNQLEKYQIGCTNPDKLDDVVYNFPSKQTHSPWEARILLRAYILGWAVIICMFIALIWLVLLLIWLLELVL